MKNVFLLFFATLTSLSLLAASPKSKDITPASAAATYNEAMALFKQFRTTSDALIGQKAEESMINALNMYLYVYKKHLEDESHALTLLASCHIVLSQINDRQGDLDIAIKYCNGAISYYKILYGEDSKQYLGLFHDLANLYQEKGDLVTAEKYLQKIVDKGEDIFKDDPADYATIVKTLSLVYRGNGRYEESEKLCESALAFLKNTIGEKNEPYLKLLIEVLTMHSGQGDNLRAIQEAEQALDIAKQLYPEPNVQVGLQYALLGSLLYTNGNIERANSLFRNAANNIGELKNRVDYFYAARIYDIIGSNMVSVRPDSAIYYEQLALDYVSRVFPKTQMIYGAFTLNLAVAYSKNGEYNRALNYFQEAETILTNTLGRNNRSTLLAIYDVGHTYYKLNQYKMAEPYINEAVSITKQTYINSVDYMSEYQRNLYWQRTKRVLDDTEMQHFLYFVPTKVPSVAGIAYDIELFTKGLLLTSSLLVQRSIQESGNPQLIAQYKELTNLKKFIANLEESNSKSPQLQQYKHQADSIEKEITIRSSAFRQNEELWNINWKSVQQHLRSDQVAIEFSKLVLSEDSIMYVALLLQKDSPYPQLIPLFKESEISDQANNIWKQLSPYLKGVKRIYFAATGGLHQLPIEYAPYDANSTWADHYDMIRVSSTRELAISREASQPSSASLFGGIFYDVDIAELAAQSETYRNIDMTATRSVVNDTSMRDGFHYLKGTKREVEEINTILQPQHISTTLYTASLANEEAFKALSGQKRNIIHIATHGFYWTDTVAQKQRYFAQHSASEQIPQSASIDPLNRCGLLFAGANIALRGHSDDLPTEVQDGILTAKEISLLDLRDAQLVVLSACETGKGEVTGDGVFGLQRAFKMAGAQSILMTLWQVNDDATCMFMTAFFRHYSQGKDKRESFRLAQQEVRNFKLTENNKTIYPFRDPYYWAGFILLD